MNYIPPTHHRFSRIPTKPRLAITGIGSVCAAGIGAPALWQALLESRSGIGTITRFDTTGMASTVAGEVKGFEPTDWIESRLKPKRLARQAQFSLVAAAEAVKDAGLAPHRMDPNRVGVIVGCSLASLETAVNSHAQIQRDGPSRGSMTAVSMGNLQGSAIAVSEMLGLQGSFTMGVSNACISGVDAVKLAGELIRSGRFDAVICGGADAPISLTPMAEFVMLGMNSTRNDEPERASRPFDRDRLSGAIAEGSGMLVLEKLDAALDRGATPYMELLGDHSAMDPNKDAPASGLELTMRGALANSSLDLGEINFLSAWGCGHPILDRCETEAIKRVFGVHAYEIAVGSIKGVTGIPLGAAGVLQIVALAKSFRENILPPTTNHECLDIDCDLDYVSGNPRRIRLQRALLNAHGMGGGNTSMAFGRVT